INARDEFQIFANREIFPEAEALSHVADGSLDAVGLFDHIEAKAGSSAGIGLEEPAEHADGRCLAAAVGPEKAPHLAFGHRDIDSIDGDFAPEALGEAVNVDGKRTHGAGARAAGSGLTSTGTPGRIGRPPATRASALNTSLSRFSWL